MGQSDTRRTAPWLAGALSVCVGALVLIGWACDVPALKSILPTWVTMKANTAVLFVLTGAALMTLSAHPAPLSARAAGFCGLSAGLVGLVGLLTLVEYVSGMNFGIDQLFFHEPASAVATSHPGRMAPDSALCFALMGAALWLLCDPRQSGRRVSGALLLCMLVTAIGGAALVPFAIPPFLGTGWFGVTNMAAHAAVVFLALGLGGVAYCQRQAASSWSLERSTTAAFLCGLALIIFSGLEMSRAEGLETILEQEAIQGRLALHLAADVSSDAADAQSSAAGYLGTRNGLFEDSYRAARARLEDDLAALSLWRADDPRRKPLVARSRSQAGALLAWGGESIDAGRKGGLDVAARRAAAGRGRRLLNELSAAVDRLKDEDARAILENDRDLDEVHDDYYSVAAAGAAAALIILLFVLMRLNDAMSARKRALETVGRLYQQNGLILGSVAEGILGLDMKGDHPFVNPAAARMLGYRPEELLGRPSHGAWHHTRPDGRPYPKEECDIYAAYRDGVAHHAASDLFWRKDGTSFLVEYTSSPIHEEGRLAGAVMTFSDITARRKAEAALANMQKLQSLGTLAGGIAHDFNNILTAILGNLSLLEPELRTSGEAKESLMEAREACQTAKALSHQLLTFAKGGHPVVKVVDLRPLLTETTAFNVRGSSARCLFELGEGPLAVNVDPEQVARVIQNLVINAAQAMPEGGDITIRAAVVSLGAERSTLAVGRYVRVTVEDQGRGIAPEHLSKVFDPYFSTKATGHGLGLAVCHSIMSRHGGDISVASKPGSGTVFTLHFPAADPADIPRPRESTAPAGGVGRVLIMDDDVLVAKVLKRMLERLGYRAESVRDGQAALDAYREARETGKPYAAVIMDLTIPGGMGGKEAMARLKAFDPHAKAIVSSGYADDAILSEFGVHGFAAVLAKPYDIEEVSLALRRVVGPA